MRSDMAVVGCAGQEAEEQGSYAFCTEPLVAAGEWTAVVEYTEHRPELSKALTKRDAVLRSTAVTFQVPIPLLSHRSPACITKHHSACSLLLVYK